MELVSLAYDVYEQEDTLKGKCPIVLIHGLFWNKFMLKEIADGLCKATKRKVYAIDLRNHGDSPEENEFDVYIVVEDVKKFLRDRELKKVVFVCHSFSCTVAYLVAINQPEFVEKIVLIDHPPFSDRTVSFYQGSVLPQFTAQNRFLKSLDPRLTLQQAKTKILSLAEATTKKGQIYFLRKVAYDLTKENGAFKWKKDQQFLISAFKEGALQPEPQGRLDHEILIIRCQDSARVTDEKFEAVLRHNPRTSLVTFEDTTHLLMFEKKEKFIETVKEFLSK